MKQVIVIAVLLLLAGCATRPVLYPNAHLKQVGEEQAQRDIAECQARRSITSSPMQGLRRRKAPLPGLREAPSSAVWPGPSTAALAGGGHGCPLAGPLVFSRGCQRSGAVARLQEFCDALPHGTGI
jgi:hypothetical protein